MAINLVPSKFQVDMISYKDFVYANYTDENVLFKKNPALKPWYDLTANKTLDYVASASPNIYGKNSSLLNAFTKNKTTQYIDSEYIKWSLKGTGKLKCYAVENLQPGNPTPGIDFGEIVMAFSHNLWVSSDTIYPECAPSVEFTVSGDAVSDGTNWLYTFQLKTRSEFDYVEPELLEPNITWCKRGANHSEASNEYGSSQIKGGPSVLTFQTQLGSYSKSHEVTDKAVHQFLRLKGKDANNCEMSNVPDQVVHFEEAEFIAECKYEREQSLFWGRDAGYNLIDPTTGLHRRTAPGMLECYEDGNLLEYDETNFTVDFLRDMFRSFFYGKVSPENANITVKCGIELLTLVNKALTKEYAMKPVQRPHDAYAKAGPSFPGSQQKGMKLSEPQFMGFDMFPYGTVCFEHLPILDDVEMNGGLVHPDTGRPLTSYWGFIDDIGLGQTNNLNHFILKGSEYLNHVCGAYSPAGAIDGTNNRGFVPAHSRRSYKVLYSIVEGMQMMDTKRTLFLHPGVQ